MARRSAPLDMEVCEPPGLRPGQVRHALFDFDGTLSLLRAGWQPVMVDYFAQVLARVTGDRTAAVDECREFITRLTGQQTIYQAIELAERVRRRGGCAEDPQAYKAEYLARLHRHIDPRREALRAGRQSPGRWLVPGALELLDGLRSAAVPCSLASGTDVEFVREEAGLLGLLPYFTGAGGQLRIHGAVREYRTFSKRLVIERLLRDGDGSAGGGLDGANLVGFGDGYVELEETRRAGGIAVGVASREDGEEGYDPWKRQRLRDAGAHLLVPDWRQARSLLDYLGVGAA